jgi:hypothetical protein
LLSPPPCCAAAVLRSAAMLRRRRVTTIQVARARQHKLDMFRFELFGLAFCLTGTAARPLRHEHGLQQSKHPRALRASLPGSCPGRPTARGIRNYT